MKSLWCLIWEYVPNMASVFDTKTSVLLKKKKENERKKKKENTSSVFLFSVFVGTCLEEKHTHNARKLS